MRVPSRRVSLAGCSITRAHLEQIWELARADFAKPDECSQVSHRQGDVEMRTATLDELFDDLGPSKMLANLTLTATEDEPRRFVRLDIGPGRYTTLTVEADDQTWALGRSEEIKTALDRARGRMARLWEPLSSSKAGSRLVWMVLVALAVAAGYGLVFLGVDAWRSASLTGALAEIVRSPLLYGLVSYLALFGAVDRWWRNKLRSYVSLNRPRAADGASLISLGVAVLSFGTTLARIFGF